jgi:uncharacterized membrane protein
MFCPNCGKPMDPQSRFCPHCGQSATPQEKPPLTPVPNYNATPFQPQLPVSAHTGRWIGEGWRLIKADLGLCMLMSLIMIVLSSFIPLILNGALAAGFQIVFMRKLMGKPIDFGDLFKGFHYFVPALVASLLIAIFTFAGMLLCVIPGLVVAAALMFTYLFIVDKKMDFWPAIQSSHNVVKGDYFGFTIFFLAAVLLNIVGVICCLVGVLATIPILFAATTVAYKEIVGFEPNSEL